MTISLESPGYIVNTRATAVSIIEVPTSAGAGAGAGNMAVAALVMHGDQDRVTTEQGARQLAVAAHPEASYVAIPNADHNALYESPNLQVWGQ
jgi:pimeloyl-ACP methyl ester carboxylesterase